MRVTSTMSRQASDTYTVKVMGAPEFVTTSEHPFYCRKKSQKWNNEIRRYDRIWSDPEWVPASDLTKDHFIGYQLDERNENVLPIGVDRAYLFGRWLGDGWFRTSKRTSTTPQGQRGSRVNSQWWQVFICASHEEAGELELAIKKAGYTAARFDERTVTKFRINSKELVQELEHFGRGARGKRVPGWAYCLPIEEQEALLKGWIDADGSYTQGQFKITTVSEQLAHGMARIARNVYQRAVSVHKATMPSTCVIEGRTVNQSDQYQVVIPESNREAFTEDGWVWAPVRKSEPLNERMVVHNFSVEEDESYTAWGITVHNCQDISAAGKRAGMKPGTRSGLWESMREAIAIIKPAFVVWENVRGSLHVKATSELEQREGRVGETVLRALGRVLGDLTDLGYNCGWETVRASDVGAPHERERVFLLATRAEATAHPNRLGHRGGIRQARNSETEQEHIETQVLAPILDTPLYEGGQRAYATRVWVDQQGYAPRALTHPSDKLYPDPAGEFYEWAMGLPEGWITDVPGVTNDEVIRMAGNGVVPQQATLALELLIGRSVEK